MNKLNPNNPLFQCLEKNPIWWETLKKDKSVYIEIRKENYIDIYYNGGNIISELKHNGKEYSGKIHYKYLLPEKSEYIKFDFSIGTQSLIQKSHVDLMNFNSFDDKTLKRIKANISSFYPVNSEKGIQASFKINTRQFIDSEFAYNFNGDVLRIDLIWIDINAKKIVPVELKTIGDNRLYTDEIVIQLKKYNDFFKEHKTQLLTYYQTLFLIKKKLNILSPELDRISTLDNYDIETRPILLLGDCKQDWIDDNSETLDNKIRFVAYGTYYYGSSKSSCNLIQPKHKNRHLYP